MLTAVVLNPSNAVTLEITVPHAGEPSTITLLSLLSHNFNFAAVMNHNIIMFSNGLR